jgi:hypothetical protein
MSEALLTDVRFHRLLLAYDEDLARRARTGRFPRCGGVLHSARYRRKPRGLPAGLKWPWVCNIKDLFPIGPQIPWAPRSGRTI